MKSRTQNPEFASNKAQDHPAEQKQLSARTPCPAQMLLSHGQGLKPPLVCSRIQILLQLNKKEKKKKTDPDWEGKKEQGLS